MKFLMCLVHFLVLVFFEYMWAYLYEQQLFLMDAYYIGSLMIILAYWVVMAIELKGDNR